MADAAQVTVHLVVDSNAEAILAKLKGGLDQTHEKAKTAGAGISSKLNAGLTAGAVALGGIYEELAEKAAEYVKKAFEAPLHAFEESEKQVRQLAGTFTLIDKGGHTFEQLGVVAEEVKNELEQVGMAAGVTDDQLVDMFNSIVERGNKSVGAAQELTEHMAYAGRAIPGGAAELARGFEGFQMGVIRARNPLVQLIAATHMLQGNAKQVAAQLQKMPVDKQMEIAEKAIGKMSEKMKNVPMTFEQLQTSVGVLTQNLLEIAGKPMLAGLTKVVEGVRGMFLTPSGEATALTKELMEGAAAFGDFLSQAFEVGQEFIGGFIEGVSIFGEEFKIIWEEAFGKGDGVFKMMLQAAHTIGQVMGAAVKFFGSGIGAIIVTLEKVLKYATLAIGTIMEQAGQIPGLGKVGAAGHAVSGMAFASEKEGLLARARATGGGGSNEIQAEYTRMVNTLGGTPEQMQAAMGEIQDAFDERQRIQAVIDNGQANALKGSTDSYLMAFQEASKAHDEGAMKQIASFLGNNMAMAQAIGETGPKLIEGGMNTFLETLDKVGNVDAAKTIRDSMKASVSGAAKGGAAINMNGGQTFNIKQDFRDQDPDRVALIFQRDLGRAAASRIAARSAGPFGF